MTCLVSKFLGRMTASSSPGFEDFSAPFLKYAYPGDEKDKNVIVPYLANLFHVTLSEKRIPACWKKAKISPLGAFTKKALSLIPTTTACWLGAGLCRLYANILRELVTKWCVENRKVPDTQFGFYPDRSTIQPMFILRHLVHAAKQIKLKDCSHLHTAFIDFWRSPSHGAQPLGLSSSNQSSHQCAQARPAHPPPPKLAQ